MTLYAESPADQTHHFADALICENVGHNYDVVATLWRSKVYAILFREIQCKNMDIVMF